MCVWGGGGEEGQSTRVERGGGPTNVSAGSAGGGTGGKVLYSLLVENSRSLGLSERQTEGGWSGREKEQKGREGGRVGLAGPKNEVAHRDAREPDSTRVGGEIRSVMDAGTVSLAAGLG